MQLIEQLENSMIVKILSFEHLGDNLKKIDEKIFKHFKIKMFEEYYKCKTPIDAKMALIEQLNYYNTRDKWTNSNIFSHESWEIGISYFAYSCDEFQWEFKQHTSELNITINERRINHVIQ